MPFHFKTGDKVSFRIKIAVFSFRVTGTIEGKLKGRELYRVWYEDRTIIIPTEKLTEVRR